MSKAKSNVINTISPITNAFLHSIFIVFAAACIIPVLTIIGTSFSNEYDVAKYGYTLWPRNFDLSAYKFAIGNGDAVVRAYFITIASTVIGTLMTTLNVALFAYPLSRKDFQYAGGFTFFLFFTMLFNGGIVPWFVVCRQLLKLTNTIWALVLPLAFEAYWVIIMRTFYKTTIHESLLESAWLDGAGEWQSFFKIVLPLSLPGLATVGLFTALMFWNSWYIPMMLTTDDRFMTVQYLISRVFNNIRMLQLFSGQMGSAGVKAVLPTETVSMALVVISVGPIIFAYPFFQRYFVKGLTIGAVKG